MTRICVHTEHCCARHGCKYGDDDCPVANKLKSQSFPCEDCDNDYNYALNIYDLLSDEDKRSFKVYVFTTWPHLNPEMEELI